MELDRNALDQHITGNWGEDQFPMTYTFEDWAEQVGEGGVIEVFDVDGYLEYVRRHDPEKKDTVYSCIHCGRMWDDGVSTAMTPVPTGRCPFEYYHD